MANEAAWTISSASTCTFGGLRRKTLRPIFVVIPEWWRVAAAFCCAPDGPSRPFKTKSISRQPRKPRHPDPRPLLGVGRNFLLVGECHGMLRVPRMPFLGSRTPRSLFQPVGDIHQRFDGHLQVYCLIVAHNIN